MTRATFADALRAAVPDLVISDEPDPGPAPEGHTSVDFHMMPISEGVLLSIKIGEDEPHRFTFASEEEAAAQLGRLFAAVH